ncbi:MAG: D-alanyl-D-alanine carboxypeptidase family protein [Armatimonadota bacterium]|nr:D-alanyl-D-alanine carboxypeptidase family protein [Armatimonadota bacterium]
MRKFSLWVLSVWLAGLVGWILALATGPALTLPGPPPVMATAAVLMDARTGQVLFERNPHLRWPPASTTKILTAILVREHLPLDKEVPVSTRASIQRSGSSIGLETGERWRVEDLLYALLLSSANDAAVALAEATSGSVEAFAQLMNEKARAIGAKNSHFAVPHGLYHPQHYSTAYDLALIARYALRDPLLAQIFRTQRWTLNRPGGKREALENRNRLLQIYPGADGIKTGWITQSGQCLVASATRKNWQLIAVVLNSPDIYTDASRLLEYGFQNFTLVKLAAKGQILGSMFIQGQRLEVSPPEDVYAVMPKGERTIVRLSFREDLSLPIPAGTPIGEATYLVRGRTVAVTPLVATEDVYKPNLFLKLWRWLVKLLF